MKKNIEKSNDEEKMRTSRMVILTREKEAGREQSTKESINKERR